MNKRIEWVDIGKYICIMFVMLAHLECKTELLSIVYKPFVRTVFFFLSGYVYKQPTSFKEHIIKKIKGLLVPWFVFSNFNIILSSIISLKANRNWKEEMLWNALQIRTFGDGMWFVAALFVAFIPFYFVIKMNDESKAIGISFALSFLSFMYKLYMPKDILPWGTEALPWHLEYIFQVMIWMVLGYYFKNKYEELFDKYINSRVGIALIILYLILVYSTSQFGLSIISVLLDYIKCILGVIVIIFICKHVRTNRYVSYVGANTLIFFALHGKLFAVIEHILSSRLSGVYSLFLSNVLASSLLAILLTLFMSVVLIIPSYFINLWFPWAVGRKRKK